MLHTFPVVVVGFTFDFVYVTFVYTAVYVTFGYAVTLLLLRICCVPHVVLPVDCCRYTRGYARSRLRLLILHVCVVYVLVCCRYGCYVVRYWLHGLRVVRSRYVCCCCPRYVVTLRCYTHPLLVTFRLIYVAIGCRYDLRLRLHPFTVVRCYTRLFVTHVDSRCYVYVVRLLLFVAHVDYARYVC